MPVRISLHAAIRGCGSWVSIVYKNYMMSHEDIVFDGYPFANKRVTRYLAATTNTYPFLNFDESSNFGAISNLTAIEINEVVNLDVPPKLNVRRYALPFHIGHTATRLPPALRLI